MSKKIHDIQAIQVDDKYLYLVFDGKSYRILLKDCSATLAHADASQRKNLIVSPSGYGIHWPEIDEDLAITPLLEKAERWNPKTA
jgi:hypothetical protein